MNKVFGILLVGLVFLMAIGSSVNAGNWNNGKKSPKQGVLAKQVYKDNDWSHNFYANCGFPSNYKDKKNVEWKKEKSIRFLRFKLANGQIGTCSTDNQNRSRAPYWERAELKAGSSDNVFYFNKTNAVEIEFRVRFVKGFVSDRETFFQIHNYVKGCQSSNMPPVMIKFSRGDLSFYFANSSLYHASSQLISRVLIEENYGKWNTFKLILSKSQKQGRISAQLFLNGKKLADERQIWVSKCGKPHVKFGIYRPGSNYEELPTSIVDYDYIKIKETRS